MNKKTVSGIMLILLLIGMLTLTFNIQPTRAGGTIYIRPDGSVEGTDKIQRDGDVYTFTDNIYDEIVVEKDNIVVDGRGHTTQGPGGGYGIYLLHRHNVTLKDVKVTNFNYGILLRFSSNNVLSGNTASNNTDYGICLEDSSSSSLIGNVASNNEYGIYLWESCSNSLSGNTVSNNHYGIYLFWDSSSNSLSNNSVSNNGLGIYLWWSCSNGLSGNVASNNTDYGICLEDSSSSSLIGNVASNNRYGICVKYYCIGSGNNVLSGNVASNNAYYGIYLWRSQSNGLSGNVASNNEYGIYLWESCSNSLSGNTVSNNRFGIFLGSYWPYECTSNSISGNMVSSNDDYGIWLEGSESNSISSNNIKNNGRQAFADLPNCWYDNYWSDYTGTDINGDGVGDTPYIIFSFNQDDYPRMKPHGICRDIGITRIAPSETSVEPGSTLDINITVLNYGFCTETFNLTAYANTTVISQTEVSLSSRNSATITFTWDTTGVTLGTYTLKAQASIVPGETDIADNILIDGQVDINIHDIAVLQVMVAPTSVKVGETVYINVTVANQGTVTETFDVTAYYNTSSIETKTSISLDAGESITLEFSWNTTGVTEGMYTISAYATLVPNEIDRADNYFEDGVVTIVTPMYLTQRLIETIETWNLPEGTESSLCKKLEDALHLLKMGKENGAIHKLMDFINHAEALREKKLTDEQVDYLISEAQRIINLIKG